MALATAPPHDPDLDRVIAAEVASELITRVAGKRLASTVGRRVPVVGGVVGPAPTASRPGGSAATPTASSCPARGGRASAPGGPAGCPQPAHQLLAGSRYDGRR